MQPLDIKQFHLRAMLMSSFGLCSRAPGQITVLLKKTVLALCCFLYGVPQKLYRQGRGRGIHQMSTLVYNPI